MSVFAPNLFKDQVFLISGGATGLGLRIAETAGRLGAKVGICGRREEVLVKAARLKVSRAFRLGGSLEAPNNFSSSPVSALASSDLCRR